MIKRTKGSACFYSGRTTRAHPTQSDPVNPCWLLHHRWIWLLAWWPLDLSTRADHIDRLTFDLLTRSGPCDQLTRSSQPSNLFTFDFQCFLTWKKSRKNPDKSRTHPNKYFKVLFYLFTYLHIIIYHIICKVLLIIILLYSIYYIYIIYLHIIIYLLFKYFLKYCFYMYITFKIFV